MDGVANRVVVGIVVVGITLDVAIFFSELGKYSLLLLFKENLLIPIVLL